MIANTSWFQQNLETTLHVMHPGISDHALLWLKNKQQTHRTRVYFKFYNCVVEMEGYDTKVKESWNVPILGRPMHVVWEKLKRLQAVMSCLNKPITNPNQDILRAREDLAAAHQSLSLDLMDKLLSC